MFNLFIVRKCGLLHLRSLGAGSLVGKAAPPDFIRKVTFITVSHDDAIRHIDTVRAYTFGSQYFVEVSVVKPELAHLCDVMFVFPFSY